MKILLKLSVLFACIFFVSCAPSIQPISSQPPAKLVRVNKPFSWGDGVFTIKLDMPKGDYKPKYEDANGYFYEAPHKITGKDSFWPILVEGGLYFEKNRVQPEKLYIIRNSLGIPTKISAKNKGDFTLVK